MAFLIQNPYNKQIMPFFVPQRDLYEVRERPSKIYKWSVFMTAQILVEALWNTVAAILFFFCWYYPLDFHRNTGDETAIRGFTTFLFIWQMIIWTSTVSQMVIAPLATADLAAVPATLIAIFSLAFCGIGITRDQLPAIWSDFMYWVSPFTYFSSGTLSSALHGVSVTCAEREVIRVPAQDGLSCDEYLGAFARAAGGVLVDTGSTDECGFCPAVTTDDVLQRFEIYYGDRWRDFGILWAYIAFNIFAALALYWLARVPKKQGVKRS